MSIPLLSAAIEKLTNIPPQTISVEEWHAIIVELIQKRMTDQSDIRDIIIGLKRCG
jgi:predicted transcriptional regulator